MTNIVTDDQYISTYGSCNMSIQDSTKGTVYISNCSMQLKKNVGFLHGVSLIIGLILGSGVFISPGLVAKDTSSTGMMFIIWIAAGLIALLGSFCYCELGCMFKMSGGNYANMFIVYGNLPAFLCAWITCLVVDPAANAAIALTLGTYFSKLFYADNDEGESTAKILAITAILISCIINSISMKLCNMFQKTLATIQVFAVCFIIVVGMWQLGNGNTQNFHSIFNGTELTLHAPMNVVVALISGLWSYDGWSSISNIVEELENLERNLPLTILTAIPFVSVCYLLAIVSFLTLLSHSEISNTKAVGILFIEKALGVKFSYFIMVMITLASFGGLNASIFASPRLTMAAAREGHMPRFFSYLYKKNSLPILGTALCGIISCLFIAPKSNNLDTLILLFGQAQWVLYTASIFGVVVLRFTQPNKKRPFRIFIGVPILLTLIGLLLIIVPCFRNFWMSCILFAYILIGIPVYLLFVTYWNKQPSWFARFMDLLGIYAQHYLGMVPCTKDDL